MTPAMIIRSHQGIPPFRLHRPASLEEALAAARHAEGPVAYMAGGVDLVPALRAGEPCADLVFLPGIAELRRIEVRDGTLRVGACVTHAEFEAHPAVAAALPEVAGIWRELGNVRVRLAGTLGGNLLAGRAHYDVAPVLQALGATLVFAGPGGGVRRPVGDGGGLLVAIEIPLPPGRRLAFDRSLKPAVSLAVGIAGTPGGALAGRLAIGCAYPQPTAAALDLAGLGGPADLAARASAVARAAVEALPPPVTDPVASGAYRRRVIGVLLRRALARLAARPSAGGGP
jgi:carbon-monoxide dehydrogenase medium subunit